MYDVKYTMSLRLLRSPYSTLTLLGFVTAGLLATACIAWAEPFEGKLWPMSPYALTPLVDMLAFTLVCVFGMVHLVRTRLGRYGTVVARVVTGMTLLAIVLHPGLLFWQLWRDGYGLPPLSYLHFYTDDQLIGVSIGTAGYALTGAVLVWYLWRQQRLTYGPMLVLVAGGAGMFWYSLLINVFVQESWFATVWVGYGILFALTMVGSLLRLRRRV